MSESPVTLEWLLVNGGMIYAGEDDTGEPMYRPDLDRLKEIAPEVYDSYMVETYRDLVHLADQGALDLVWDDEQNDFAVVFADER